MPQLIDKPRALPVMDSKAILSLATWIAFGVLGLWSRISRLAGALSLLCRLCKENKTVVVVVSESFTAKVRGTTS